MTNGEYLEFMPDGGYGNPAFWLSDGWATVKRQHWSQPAVLGIARRRQWWQYTLGGLRTAEP